MKIRTIRPPITRRAFTLIEVMFAVAAFCIATFAILALISNSLADARRLQRPMVDAGEVASWLSQTNQLVESTYKGNLGDLLGDAYNGYNYTCDVEPPVYTNLSQVDFTIQSDSGDKPVVSKMSILLFRRNSLTTQ